MRGVWEASGSDEAVYPESRRGVLRLLGEEGKMSGVDKKSQWLFRKLGEDEWHLTRKKFCTEEAARNDFTYTQDLEFRRVEQ